MRGSQLRVIISKCVVAELFPSHAHAATLFERNSALFKMADSLPQDTANLHLDEVTGEKVSKSELKKRQKQREQERKKAEKAAAAPPKPAAKKAANDDDESDLTPNVCR